ncbi:Down syndrome cell adhesion molecule homolog isoform X1 [Limulus polyphemus]|uniref:Down syndrome cell adhesion molecule homolog isoform X1 n=1 Tax=Limulus polyphemus TaxID=6850 RepID=A0ABM1SUG7_LIMPO|nr:Down syndrome cell adhesion molecule homolog isoform X1 [Limulus polyphemus]
MARVLWILTTLSVAGSSEKLKRSPNLAVFNYPYISTSTNFTIIAGETVVLDCPLGGVVRDEISWEKGSRRIPDNQRQRIFPNGSLVISNINSEQDEGHYECSGSTQNGQLQRKVMMLNVRVAPKIDPFTFKSDLSEGSRAAISCVVVAGDSPMFVKWFKDGHQLADGDHGASIVVAAEGYVSTLTLDNLSRRFNGNYTCRASNAVGTDSYSAYLEVKAPPHWTKPPVDSSPVLGRSMVLHCQAEGYPAPHIRWKVAKGTPPGPYTTIISRSRIYILVNGSLVITSVQKEDEGLYLCEASNGVGQPISSAVALTVNSPPQFVSKFSSQTLRKGDRAVIRCNTIGETPIFIQWRVNGKEFDPSNRRSYKYREDFTQEGRMAEIIIPSVTRDDSATYTCVARNDYGEDNVDIEITVQEIPDMPHRIRVQEITSRVADLSWPPPYDGNSEIIEYVVQWREEHDHWNENNQRTVKGTETSTRIGNLKPQTNYRFRIRAKNSIGAGNFSTEIQQKTAAEPPQSSPSDVRAVAVKSRAIIVSWSPLKELETGVTVQGYYVGVKPRASSQSFTFRTVMLDDENKVEQEISGLERDTEYIVIVQGFNSKGPGPPSDEVYVKTPKYDRPRTPVLKISVTTATSITVTWDRSKHPHNPVSGYTMLYKKENSVNWQTTNVNGDETIHTIQSLDCGAVYQIYLVAFNIVGKSEPSQTISAKTDGHAPIAPNKAAFLTANSTYVILHLNAWRNGGCPIKFFVIQYRLRDQMEWTLVSNNILPNQQDIIVAELTPGTWYTLLTSAHNDAGITDAEFVLATLTLNGEFPRSPSEIRSVNFLYRHLTVTVPVASSLLVLIVVFIVVCQVTRRRSPGPRNHSPEGTENSEQLKQDNMSLTVTYDSNQESAYLPAPYATTKVPMYSREQSGPPRGGCDPSMRTFGSSRHLYDVPNPNRKIQSRPVTSNILVNEYQKSTLLQEGKPYLYRKSHNPADHGQKGRRRDFGDGSSGSESDEEIRFTTNKEHFKESDHDIIHGSETECDRQWKKVRRSRNQLDELDTVQIL